MQKEGESYSSNNRLVSIIVPFYNAQTYLPGCIQSIQKQTFTDWELILIDDGSTDESLRIASQYEQEDSRIRLFHQENKGVSVARNLGLLHAKGDFLMFVDADDRLQERMLWHLYHIQKTSGCDLVCCGFREIYPEQTVVSGNGESLELPAYRLLDQKMYLREELLQGDTRCWSKLFCRTAVDRICFREGITIGEDLLFLIDCLPQIVTVAVTEYQGYEYMINQTGAMNAVFKPSYMDQITCWQITKQSLITAYPEVQDRLDTILMISIMLVAGKLACLPKKQRLDQKPYVDQCQTLLRELRKNKKAVSGLDFGYRLKTCFFAAFANMYLNCYYYWKR